MPSLPLKHCEAPGCKAMSKYRRCEIHRRMAERIYDSSPQRKQARKVLDTARWRRLRLMHLRNNPLCNLCGKPANQVDHIIARKADEDLTFDADNLQSLCRACHTRKTRNGR